MKYLIGTGYHSKDGSAEFFTRHWFTNTIQHSSPSRIIVIGDSGTSIPWPAGAHPGLLANIQLFGDLGGYRDLLEGRKPHAFNGWSGVVMAAALLAYCNESDFIYKEQDCLWFGDPVGEMYRQLGDGGIIFGSYDQMPCAQSLFLVRHAFIPEFVSTYLSSPPQRTVEELGENKFAGFERRNPGMWKRFGFGYDRQRPVDHGSPTFYVQQCTTEELNILHAFGLI